MIWFRDNREELNAKPYQDLQQIIREYESMLTRLKLPDKIIHRTVDGIGRFFGCVTQRRKYLTTKEILNQKEQEYLSTQQAA